MDDVSQRSNMPKFERLDRFGPFVLASQAYESLADLTADLMIAYDEIESLKLSNMTLLDRNKKLEKVLEDGRRSKWLR